MVSLYCDGADLEQMETLAADQRIEGFTTNPSLMRKAGITNYRAFARTVLSVVGGKSVSFEVLADDFQTMEQQAREITSWGPNVYVKIPITNTLGESSAPLVRSLWDLNLNITAVMTLEQIAPLQPILQPHHIVSIFAGRIMDTGRLPPIVSREYRCRMLWASAREVYHVTMAKSFDYDIITLTPDLIAKLALDGKDLARYSLETVRQFHSDGKGISF